jgi:hypothetical protein
MQSRSLGLLGSLGMQRQANHTRSATETARREDDDLTSDRYAFDLAEVFACEYGSASTRYSLIAIDEGKRVRNSVERRRGRADKPTAIDGQG